MKLEINVVRVTDSCLHEVVPRFIPLNKYNRSQLSLFIPQDLTFHCFRGDSSCIFIVKMCLKG